MDKQQGRDWQEKKANLIINKLDELEIALEKSKEDFKLYKPSNPMIGDSQKGLGGLTLSFINLWFFFKFSFCDRLPLICFSNLTTLVPPQLSTLVEEEILEILDKQLLSILIFRGLMMMIIVRETLTTTLMVFKTDI